MTTDDRRRSPWRRSSYSVQNGNCVEAAWRRSSYSMQNGDCVEAAGVADRVLVRDSKDPDGPTLSVTPARWRHFVLVRAV